MLLKIIGVRGREKIETNKQQKILVVDDEEMNLRLFAAVLENYDYIYETARNGIEALEKTKEMSPDLIFLDIMMPGMDGYEVCKRLKENPETQNIPVIMVTALTDKDAKIEGLKVGANDFITKPIDSIELMVTAQNLLKIKEFEDLIIRYNQRLEEEVRSRTYDIKTYAEDLEKEVEKRTEELTVSNKYLEKANRAKSEFLATMSHELRTPFSSIIGFSEILQDEKFGKLNEKQAEHVTNILTSGRHLLELINDLLDLSKIESGRMTLTLNKFSFPKLIEGIETILKEQALRKNITIRSRIASDVTIINADEKKIKQIIYNLLSNAVKFTPDGGKVDIKVDIKDEELRVSVTDTGIGIKQEDMDKLFKAFQQIDSKYVRKYGGTGLGLSLTKEMVKLHGGEIWVKSESGKGSTFTFTISLRKNKV